MNDAEAIKYLRNESPSMVYLLSVKPMKNKDLANMVGVEPCRISYITGKLHDRGVLKLNLMRSGRTYEANPDILVTSIKTSEIAQRFESAFSGSLAECEAIFIQIAKNFLREYYSGVECAYESWNALPSEDQKRCPFIDYIYPLLNQEKTIFSALAEHILSANLLLEAEELQMLGHDELLPRIRQLSQRQIQDHISYREMASIMRFTHERGIYILGTREEVDQAYSGWIKEYDSMEKDLSHLHTKIIYHAMRGESIQYLVKTCDALASNRKARIMLYHYSRQLHKASDWFSIHDLIIPEKARGITSEDELLNRAGRLLFWDLQSQLPIPPSPSFRFSGREQMQEEWRYLKSILASGISASFEGSRDSELDAAIIIARFALVGVGDVEKALEKLKDLADRYDDYASGSFWTVEKDADGNERTVEGDSDEQKDFREEASWSQEVAHRAIFEIEEKLKERYG